MEANEDLVRLAGVVEDLLTRFNQLKDDHKKTVQALQDSDAQVKELQDLLGQVQNEKSDAYERISGILGSIEQWENSLEQDEKSSTFENSSDSTVDDSSPLFTMDS